MLLPLSFWFAPGSDAAATSSKPFTLSGWELSLPVNSSGHLSGKAAAKLPAKLTPPWLSRQPDGGLRFFAPSRGATTSHSFHTRTELVWLKRFPAGNAGHYLTATLVAEELPAVTHRVVIGQIHGTEKYSAAPFVLLELRGTTLVVSIESKPKLEGSKGPSNGAVVTDYDLMSGVGVGKEFTYTITAARNNIRVTASFGAGGGSAHSVTAPVPAAWKGRPVTFHAGAYGQDNAASATSGGSAVVFYALRVH
jgi:hypothetical protein